jgi:uncharacterized membrane protein YedE/YeeE
VTRRTVRLAGFGLAIGFVLAASGLADPGYVLGMFTLGAATGAEPAAAFGAWATLLAAVLTAAAGFALLARGDALPSRPLRRGTVPGALAFGAGWALSGTCPAAAFVQLGQGHAAAAATLAGMLAGFALHRAARRRLRLDGAGCAGG